MNRADQDSLTPNSLLQYSTPYAAIYNRTPDDGHIDARNMWRQFIKK
jgi:hypothetical protein